MIPSSLLVILLSGVLARSPLHEQKAYLVSLLPREGRIQGWSRVDTARIYEGNALYDFIDGGADLFFEYGFRRALSVEYQSAGGKSINLEVYEMKDPGSAFGIYSIRSGEEATQVDIGQRGNAHAYYIMFWKGRFYVSVASSDSTGECRSGLEATARAVDQNISSKGQKPHVVDLLPAANLGMSRYFRGNLGLSSTSILDVKGLFPVVDGAIGTYRDHTTVLLRYGSAADAERHLADFSAYIKTDERFKGYQRRGQMAVVADSGNRALCFGHSGLYIIVSISSREAIAKVSCEKAISLIRGH